MKIISLLITLVFSSFIAINAQEIFLEEDFENGIPADWTVEEGWLHGTNTDLSSQAFNIPTHSQFMCINDDGVGAGVSSKARLITPAIAVPEVGIIELNYETFYRDLAYLGDQEEAKILVSADNMETWQEVEDITGEDDWQIRTVFIMEDMLTADSVFIAFDYDDSDGWLYGFCVDNVTIGTPAAYNATIDGGLISPYTIKAKSQSAPFQFETKISNTGLLDLTDLSIDYEISKDGNLIESSSASLNVSFNSSTADSLIFDPTEVGVYTIEASVTHPELSETSSFTHICELSDSVLAQDDGVNELGLGFGFGNPIWYGYYGSQFNLTEADSVTSISVFIAFGSDADGTINLTITPFDEVGEVSPNEIYHSPELELTQSDIGNFLSYELTEPIGLSAGNYIFAAGQDTIQGVIGFGFDDSYKDDFFWITSPVAGGGYPWTNTIGSNEVNMMIRPNFGGDVISSLPPTTSSTLALAVVYPNPIDDKLIVKFAEIGDYYLELHDLSGRIVKRFVSRNDLTFSTDISYLLSGSYYLIIKSLDKSWASKLIKK